MRRRWLLAVVWCMIVALGGLRFAWLTADFPNGSRWGVDQAKYTDEGWWSQGAVMHQLTGHWSVPGDYNPAAALPVWPVMLGVVFHFSGVAIVAARAAAVGFSLGTMGLVFWLMRRYAGEIQATVAVLLLAASPFVFVFSRLAILDSLMVFELVLLMVMASYARRGWVLAPMVLLATMMLLTKTTAAVLLPAVVWLAWEAMGRKWVGMVKAMVAVVLTPALLLMVYVGAMGRLGYGEDYRYFFSVNAMSDMVWGQSLVAMRSILRDGMWVDRVLYPMGLVVLVVSMVWLRRLWRNPLFAASWIAIGAQAVFLFRRSDDYAPRYFLVMVVPVIFVVVLGIAELRREFPKVAMGLGGVVAVGLVANVGMIASLLHRRTFDFYEAACSIKGIVRGDARQKPLLLGISGSEMSLMTGIASINDAYGTMTLAEKVRVYRPGWYLAWTGIGPEEAAVFAPEYQMVRVV